MALKALMLRKKIDTRSKELEALLEQRNAFLTRESELETAIAEAETAEEETAVEEAIDALNAEKAATDKAIEEKQAEVDGLKAELAEQEKEDVAAEEQAEESNVVEEPKEERRSGFIMNKRNVFSNLTAEEQRQMFEREDVRTWMTNTREEISNKRSITNIGLTIPEVFVGYLKELVPQYSKLYKHLLVKRVSGEARMVVMGGIQEAIWTECCANLNEMSMNFNDATVDCFKVGGYYAVCNANLEDSDIALASEILDALARGIGYALDKAVLYGKNTTANSKMPLGVVSRLLQEAQPSDYSATARTWADLHTTNVISITAANSTGVKLFQNILKARAVAKNDFSVGGLTWVMNENTYYTLMAEAMSINASGAIVSGMGNTMPVIGGAIELLDFVPDNVIIAGHFDLYLLAERAGAKFASSEHVRFLQDQTVYKGTARYDGMPLIAESFVAIGINAVTPTATMTFASDTANS